MDYGTEEEQKKRKTAIAFAGSLAVTLIVVLAYSFSGSAPERSDTIEIVLYGDYLCPHSAQAYKNVKHMQRRNGDAISFTFKHLPLRDNSELAAQAAECARDQGKFWEYHDGIFDATANTRDAGTRQVQDQVALDLWLNMGTFRECMDTGSKASIVEADLADGMSRGFRGTPTFLINGDRIEGAIEITPFERYIDGLLN